MPMEKKYFKNEDAQRIAGILNDFSLIEFEVFFRKGKARTINEESTHYNELRGRYVGRTIFESAFPYMADLVFLSEESCPILDGDCRMVSTKPLRFPRLGFSGLAGKNPMVGSTVRRPHSIRA
jgi:hypothetical protein